MIEKNCFQNFFVVLLLFHNFLITKQSKVVVYLSQNREKGAFLYHITFMSVKGRHFGTGKCDLLCRTPCFKQKILYFRDKIRQKCDKKRDTQYKNGM